VNCHEFRHAESIESSAAEMFQYRADSMPAAIDMVTDDWGKSSHRRRVLELVWATSSGDILARVQGNSFQVGA